MFDPYHKWLGIPRDQRPPTYYQLLGIVPSEGDPEVIEEMAIRQTSHVRGYQTGPHAAECTRLLNEIAQARRTLLDPARRKKYDAGLRATPAAPQRAEAPALAAVGAPAFPDSAWAEPAEPAGATMVGFPPDPFAAPDLGDLSSRPRRRRRKRSWHGALALGATVLAVAAGWVVLWRARAELTGAETPGTEPAARVSDVRGARTEGPLFEQYSGAIHAVAFAPDGRTVAFGGAAARPAPGGAGPASYPVCLANATTGKELRRLAGHQAPVRAVAFSGDGRRLLSAAGRYDRDALGAAAIDCTVRLWDVTTGKELWCFKRHEGPVYGVAFLPGDRHAASCGEDGTVRLWELRTGRQLDCLKGPDVGLRGVAVSPDGRRALTGGADGVVRLWDLWGGGELRHFEHGAGAVAAVAFSPDGRLALAGSGRVEAAGVKGSAGEPSLRLWDVESGGEVVQFAGCTQPVLSVAFAPDGRRAVSAGRDKAVRLWDLATGREVCRLDGRDSAIERVAFSPDGRRLFSGSTNGVVRLWDLPPGQTARP
jgi:dipeptidyl aminopeptidase/acylaminoacyl peptidase